LKVVNRNLRHKIKVGTDEEKKYVHIAGCQKWFMYMLPVNAVSVACLGGATFSAISKGQQNKYFKWKNLIFCAQKILNHWAKGHSLSLSLSPQILVRGVCCHFLCCHAPNCLAGPLNMGYGICWFVTLYRHSYLCWY
jgi:hypothetical protein